MQEKIYGYWLPINVSTHGEAVDQLINVLHVFMALLFVCWGIFFVYCLIRFRQGANPQARYEPIQSKTSKYLEVVIVVFEAFLLVGLSMPVWSDFKSALPSESEALTVHVMAEQFAWNVHYPGGDGVFGRKSFEFVTSENLLGLDPDDPNGKDDFNSINNLHIPMGKPILIKLTSKDVIHSFKVPVLRLTQDAIPGQEIPFWFNTTRTGDFDIACAQLCGLGHYRMRGQLHIQTPADFNAWLADQVVEDSDDEFSF
jgi:cytochrome c oxidase subunit 2